MKKVFLDHGKHPVVKVLCCSSFRDPNEKQPKPAPCSLTRSALHVMQQKPYNLLKPWIVAIGRVTFLFPSREMLLKW